MNNLKPVKWDVTILAQSWEQEGHHLTASLQLAQIITITNE